MKERALAERLVTYDTSALDGIRSAAGFVKGWLEARDIDVVAMTHNERPVLAATVGAERGPTVILHGHLDVVPARPEQFVPRVEGDRLWGRGVYDMKGGLAAMMLATAELATQRDVRVHFLCVADEESEDPSQRASDMLVEHGYQGDFAITGEPTDLHIGVQAKGVLALRIEVAGSSAHGSTPWKGDNAVLKALDVFRTIEAMPFAREASEMFDRPSINLGRMQGGDAINRVPDHCTLHVDIRYLPGQDPQAILAAVREIPDCAAEPVFHRDPAIVAADHPLVVLLARAVREDATPELISVGRDGASDAISFLAAGIPAVEFGPVGGGHHGPEEWVSIASLARYSQALVRFVESIAAGQTGRRLRVA